MVSIFVFGLLLADLVSGNSLSRIVGGTETTLKAHPHQVSLQGRWNSHICGGSIINEQWILTAAHCVESGGASTYSVSLNNGYLSGLRTVYSVASIWKHPQYNKGSGAYPNDIALLKLTSTINFDEFEHKPIALPSADQTFAGSQCTITGWGLTDGANQGSIPDTLQQTSGKILTDSECTREWSTNYNADAHICIHHVTSGSCNGDSGGPMVCSGVLAGVTSWGASGCITSYPSVYARVSSYREWIDSTIAAN